MKNKMINHIKQKKKQLIKTEKREKMNLSRRNYNRRRKTSIKNLKNNKALELM